MGLSPETMMRSFAAALALLAGSPAIAAAPAPHVHAQGFDQLAQPLPLPYDENVDAMAAVGKARIRARAGHKLLLIDLGGNWCLDCRILAGTMDLPEVAAFMRRHFELIAVDVGRFDKNLAVPAHYGITQRLEGVPSLLVVDPRTDRLINTGRVSALADARSMTPQALVDWLAQWAR
jgi:thiol-disulfide isomerase/thioredoxin